MKQDWETKKLGDLCEIYQPKTISAKEMVEDGRYKVFGANGVIGKYDKYNHEEPQLLITCRGATCGSVNISEPKSWITGNAMVVRPIDNSIISKKFLEYLFRGGIDLSKVITGAAQPQITRRSMAPVMISFPKDLSEQHRIVSILDSAFAAIDKAKANAERNRKNAKKLFESMLIKIFKEGISVKHWELEKLEKYSKVVVGYVGPISSAYTKDSSGIVLLSTKNIGDNGLNLDKLTLINRQFHSKNTKSQLHPGDILVARHGNSGQSAVIPAEIGEAHALNVIIIKRSQTLLSEYISFLLNSGILDKISSSKGGSVQEIINTSVIKELIIPVPSMKDQEEVVNKLKRLKAETEKLQAIYQQKLDDLDELRKSILQKTFNGELKSAEKELV